ncbi:hypothetical protein MJO28_000880, partial [Puccinia striiformis f. sp. tritici]
MLHTGLNNSCGAWTNQVKHFFKKADPSVLDLTTNGLEIANLRDGQGHDRLDGTSRMDRQLISPSIWNLNGQNDLPGSGSGILVADVFKSISLSWLPSVCWSLSASSPSVSSAPSTGKKLLLRLVFLTRSKKLEGFYNLAQLSSRTVSAEQSIEMLMETLFPPEFLAQEIEGGQTKQDKIHKALTERVSTTLKQLGAGVVLCHSCPMTSLLQINHKLLSSILSEASNSKYLLIPSAGHVVCSQPPEQFNVINER